MKTYKLVLILILLSTSINLSAQNLPILEGLRLYYIQFNGISGDEEGRYVGRLISKCDGVIIVACNFEGFARVVADKEISVNDILFKLSPLNNVTVENMNSVLMDEKEYLSVYYERGRISMDSIENVPPPMFQMADKVKLEKAYSLANKVWESLYLKKSSEN